MSEWRGRQGRASANCTLCPDCLATWAVLGIHGRWTSPRSSGNRPAPTPTTSRSHAEVATKPDDIHVIRFSAGTTGRPKGIVHTVERWLAIGDEYRWVTPQIDERDSYLAAGQLTHAAVIFLWPMLQVGGRTVVMEAFDP